MSNAQPKSETLAMDGGTPIRTSLIPRRKTYGLEEARQVLEALESDSLFIGPKVYGFLESFRKLYGVQGVVASSSGTAAIHVALGALGLEPGDEVIVPPVTDMGSVAPIILSGAIPVFVDVEEETFNLDPQDLARKITDRTRAVIVVHVWGRPADMDAVKAAIGDRKIAIIEDCAEAHFVHYRDRILGTIGDFGCFSFQGSKHITSGDGGATIVNRSDLLARAELFVDKGCDWTKDRLYRKTYAFIAPCYRMTELQGAVLIAQMAKLPNIIQQRRIKGDRLVSRLQGIPGVRPPLPSNEVFEHGYWFFPIRIIKEELGGADRDLFGKALLAEGIKNHTWISKPLYLYDALADRVTFGTSSWPMQGTGREVAPWKQGLCPVAEKIMSQLLAVIGLHESTTDAEMDDLVNAIRKVAYGLKAKA